jgi:hypothetical protein
VICLRTYDHAVQPSSCFDVVKPRDDEFELLVEGLVPVLHHPLVRRDLAACNAPHNEVRRGLRLALPHVAEAEQELAVQIADVDRIQICKIMDLYYALAESRVESWKEFSPMTWISVSPESAKS